MISHGFRHLPVIEHGTLQGIVSLRDVLSDRMRPDR
jgi:CBS domain-containing protein